jgi:hypothetical protein
LGEWLDAFRVGRGNLLLAISANGQQDCLPEPLIYEYNLAQYIPEP